MSAERFEGSHLDISDLESKKMLQSRPAAVRTRIRGHRSDDKAKSMCTDRARAGCARRGAAGCSGLKPEEDPNTALFSIE